MLTEQMLTILGYDFIYDFIGLLSCTEENSMYELKHIQFFM